MILLTLLACDTEPVTTSEVFDGPTYATVLHPGDGGPFYEPVGIVSSERSGAISLLDVKHGWYVADDPAYAEIKLELLAELQQWRSDVVRDEGVSDVFRAAGVFPESRPGAVTDDWVNANQGNYDFDTLGWPAWYPTRTLEEWEKVRALWEPYVMRGPGEDVPRPSTVHSRKKNRKKK